MGQPTPSHVNGRRVVMACLVAGLAWIVCEVLGGLAFLAAGIRLWHYNLLPIWFDVQCIEHAEPTDPRED